MNKTEAIAMLTRNDYTIPDAEDVFMQCRDSGISFWGMKEKSLHEDQMKSLFRKMKEAGKKCVLEVVEYTAREGLEGARLAVSCGADVLMGTVFTDEINALCRMHGIMYMPFVGKLSGRPTVMSGSIDEIIAEAKAYEKKGVCGFDLLAYRYAGDCTELLKRFCAEIHSKVCVAGSVDTPLKISEIKKNGAWAFTVGQGLFDGSFGDSPAESAERIAAYV